MSIRSAGKIIRDARLTAGLSQEKLSEDICSPVSLNKIENDKQGVSPGTFQLLMQKAGAHSEIYPIFENQEDFDCFHNLQNIRYYLKHWKLDQAYSTLHEIEDISFGHNKAYYFESMILYCSIQYHSYCADAQKCIDLLLDGLTLMHPGFQEFDFRKITLSFLDTEALLLLANFLMNQKEMDRALNIIMQVKNIQNNSLVSDYLFLHYRNMMLLTYSRYLFLTKDFKEASNCTAKAIIQINSHFLNAYEFEFHILHILSDYHAGNTESFSMLPYLIEAAWDYGCNFVPSLLTFCEAQKYPLDLSHIKPKALVPFPERTFCKPSPLKDGVFDIYDKDVITIHKMIHNARILQNCKQDALCKGLCSKSKLSKIENGTQNPDILLAEALLTRLGFSERDYTFYGNENESKFHELKMEMLSFQQDRPKLQKILSQMEELNVAFEEPLIYQVYLMLAAKLSDDLNHKIELAYEALSITQPDFQPSEILSHYYSWTEICILNILAPALCKTEQVQIGEIIFQQLLLYKDTKRLSNSFLSSFEPTTTLYMCYLYENKLFSNITYFASKITYRDFCISNIPSYLYYLYRATHASGDACQAVSILRKCIGYTYITGGQNNLSLLLSLLD